jgi:hypothetical protein
LLPFRTPLQAPPPEVENPANVGITGSPTSSPAVIGIFRYAAATTVNTSRPVSTVVVVVVGVPIVILEVALVVVVRKRRIRGGRTEERAGANANWDVA